MLKFKVGDVVRCTECCSFDGGLTVGKEYKVISVRGVGERVFDITVRGDTGEIGQHPTDEFEKMRQNVWRGKCVK